MSDLAHVALTLTPLVAPIAGAPDPLHSLAPRPARSEDPFGPAVVMGPAVRSPALVLYDAQGRLTAALPAYPATDVMPPARIDVSRPDAPRSLVYMA
jgi:hypothetical protein